MNTNDTVRPSHTGGSSQRESRVVDGPLTHTDVRAVVSRLKEEPAFQSDGRNSMTVVHDGGTRAVIFVADSGREIGAEQSDGYVALDLIDGDADVRRGPARERLVAPAMAVVAPGSDWSLHATRACTVIAYFWQ